MELKYKNLRGEWQTVKLEGETSRKIMLGFAGHGNEEINETKPLL